MAPFLKSNATRHCRPDFNSKTQVTMPNMRYYVVVCDKAGHVLEQTFTHPAPEWLFDESVDNAPAYLKILSDKFHAGILQETSWQCLGCDKTATKLVSRPLCFVHKGIIANFLVPVCQSEDCEHVAIMHHNKSETSIDAMIYSESGGSSNLADGMRDLAQVTLTVSAAATAKVSGL